MEGRLYSQYIQCQWRNGSLLSSKKLPKVGTDMVKLIFYLTKVEDILLFIWYQSRDSSLLSSEKDHKVGTDMVKLTFYLWKED